MGQRGASFSQRMVLAVDIHQRPLLGSDRFPVRLFGTQKVFCFVKHDLADELFVAQSERGDSP